MKLNHFIRESIEDTLKPFFNMSQIKSVKETPDGLDIVGDIYSNSKRGTISPMEEIPVKLAKVTGEIVLNHCNLKSCKNFPTIVDGTIDISDNPSLTSLDGLENTIIKKTSNTNGKFIAKNIGITSLFGAPVLVENQIILSANKHLESTRGLNPRSLGNKSFKIILQDCPKLRDIENLLQFNSHCTIKIDGTSKLLPLVKAILINGKEGYPTIEYATYDAGLSNKLGIDAETQKQTVDTITSFSCKGFENILKLLNHCDTIGLDLRLD